MNESGTYSNVILIDFNISMPDPLPDRWLVLYQADEDAGLLWHDIIYLTDSARESLTKRLINSGVAFYILNLTEAEKREPFTIYDYLEDKERRQ